MYQSFQPRVFFFDRPGTMIGESKCANYFQSRIVSEHKFIIDPIQFMDCVSSSQSDKNGALFHRFIRSDIRAPIDKTPLLNFGKTTLQEHEHILQFYMNMITSLAANMINAPKSVAIVQMTYFQEYANHTYLSDVLTASEKASLLERYKNHHVKVLGGYESVRVLLHNDQEVPLHSLAYRARHALKTLNVTPLFNTTIETPDSTEAGASLVARFVWPY